MNVEQRLERELKRDYHVITASQAARTHREGFRRALLDAWETGKAMLVAIDKITACACTS